MTRSKLPNWMMFAGALVVVAIIAIASGVKFPTGIIGGDVLSLSQVDIQSTNPLFPVGKVWLANVVLNGGGQTLLTKTASTTELTSADSTDREKPTEPVEFRFQLNSENISYTLQNSGFDLYSLTSTSKTFSISFQGTLGTCTYSINGANAAYASTGGQCGFGVTPPTDLEFANGYQISCPGTALNKVVSIQPSGTRTEWYCYAIEKQSIGKVYTLVNPALKWSASFTLDPLSKSPDSLVLTSDELNGKISGQGNIFVKWTQNTIGNEFNPEGSFPDVLLPNTGSYEKTGSNTKEFAQNNPNPQSTWADGANKDTALNGVVSYNTQVTAARSGSYNSLFSSSTFFFGKLYLDFSSSPRYYPNFQVIAKADWMGIKIPFPRPVIVSVPNVQFISGSGTGTVLATLRNDGEYGSFDVSVSCPAPVSAQGSTMRQTFNAGEQKTVNIALIGQPINVASQTVTCSITASDSNDNTNKATGTFQTTLLQQCTLQPYGNWLVNVNTCTYYCGITQSSCPSGYQFDANTCSCYQGNTPTPTATPTATPIPNECLLNPSLPQCQKPFDLTPILIGIVAVLVIVVLYMEFGKKRKGGKRK